MKSYKIKEPALLSTLWIFVLFNMIFRDLHQFANKVFVEELMSSEFPEELVLVFGFVIEIPIVMVLLSRILKNNINKWANVIAALITLLGLLSTLPSADMDDIFFTIIETAGLIAVILIAWKLTSHSRTE